MTSETTPQASSGTAAPLPAAPAAKPANGKRKRALLVLAALVVLAGIGWLAYYLLVARWHEQTDDAYAQGNIVNIVATFQRGMPGVAHTCAARAAVTYLSKTVAVEWAQYGIRVNCIAPGAIASTGFRQYSPEAVKAFAGANPMKHVGDVQDVAEAVVYLSAPSGKFITDKK